MATIDRSRPYFQCDIDGDVWLVAEGEDRFTWKVYDDSGALLEPDDNVNFVWSGPFRAWAVTPQDSYTITR